MREWNLQSGDPLSLIISADARLTNPNYFDDIAWELHFKGGEPPALAVQTTYGLRARNFRLFPRFIEGEEIRADPTDFASPPILRHFYPNFLTITYSPFEELDLVSECWVPESQAVAGRLRLTNRSNVTRWLQLELVALLTPADGGEPIAPAEIQATPVLSGVSHGLYPVIFMTGGATATRVPYPALAIGLEMLPGSSRQLIWSHAATSTKEASFELARSTAARQWEAERARIEMLNNGQVEIHSGDPDWDVAFALAQKTALSLFMGPTEHLPHQSFINIRHPDLGFSLRGDGSDYGHLWNGQAPLKAYALSGLVLPAAPQLVKGLLLNFLSTQDEHGYIDWKPGMAGQRGNRLATPLLSTLAWKIYETEGDHAFLSQVYPQLLNFVRLWFAPEHDRDGDGIPEWDHPMQSGFDDHPLFARWHTWADGIDITTVESPVLCAFLRQELQVLMRMAQILEQPEAIRELNHLAEKLTEAVEHSWDAQSATYRYWDRDTHLCNPGELISERSGTGEFHLNRNFDEPARLVLRIKAVSESTRRPLVFIHGISPSGSHRVERITADRFQWFIGLGTATSERTYTSIESVEVQGLDPADRFTLHTANLTGEDHTLLIPLWAEMPDQERAHELVNRTITNPRRYWRPFGLPASPDRTSGQEPDIYQNVHIPWSILVGEGLVKYGYRAEAAELLIRMMEAIVRSLRKEGAFRRFYNTETGKGQGERDALGGLAPLSLFLDILGVRLISGQRVGLSGLNPFPWPITVKYRGLTILRQKEKTLVIFPDGQTTVVSDPSPCIVANE
jgi:hypothetical protein